MCKYTIRQNKKSKELKWLVLFVYNLKKKFNDASQTYNSFSYLERIINQYYKDLKNCCFLVFAYNIYFLILLLLLLQY